MHQGGEFTGTRRLAFKESSRAAAMQEELRKFGADVRIGEDTVAVSPGIHTPAEPLSGHNDHRIVMALAVLCARTGGTIIGAEAVRKSFPDFFEVLASAGVRLEIIP
jgi:3-phosphoshikimate 1-carboxyvinyltransferase